MKFRLILGIFLLILIGLNMNSQERMPAVSGSFYPSNPIELKEMVEKFIQSASLPELKGDVRGVISPHAGYLYSGPVAGYSYRAVKGKNFDAVVIIGPSHRVDFDGSSVYQKGFFITPLGKLKIAEDIAKELISFDKSIYFYEEAHTLEHSVEVQLPFIQVALGDVPIVPIVMGRQTEKNIKILADALYNVISDKNVLLVASTDLSHYYPRDVARRIDLLTKSLIEKFEPETLMKEFHKRRAEMCGGGPVIAVLMACKRAGAKRVVSLSYKDSADVVPMANVVGYLSAVILNSIEKKESLKQEFNLTEGQKEKLLKIARDSIEAFVKEGKIIELKEDDPIINTKTGVFVTLKEHGMLRGCIGFTEPLFPLYQGVQRAGIFAATRDPRFTPLSKEELPLIHLEISVLTSLRRINNVKEIIVGKHGIMIEKEGKRGLLLPQVAVENGWNREQFLDQTCIKANLPYGCWKKDAEIQIFEAIIFEEKKK
ncbi:MAG: AmmeMemoRadiSam system protein B [Candidatus Aminicenantia bacterium]